ncbi:MAG TPA: LysR family transcriptional regulator [Bosea sp. (in: a-proteobacteria)]|jgi:DNA-binding transcriptional LysR family regulator|uniref:LysR substrate-binding domain-containing protein n=1 Tax=Bosea sp. (in: a-proteobacteria) TaxID=1871050 RepID=UPI002E14FFF3|nr:LysR family transcriptional regulator [Bosea sp. (in: a-proteobacteria)]
MDQLNAMRAFVRVVEAGTFSRAADLLDMPKPTVTKQIQQLEAHLRAKLLNRTTRRVTVTMDGAAYYERALRVLGEIDELDASMALSQARPSGRLRVESSAALAVAVVIPALPDFHARYPEIQVDFGLSDRPTDLLGENVDCALRAGEIGDQSLIARRIGEMYLITCATPDYLARHGTPLHPSDLEAGHRIVGYRYAAAGRVLPFTYVNGEESVEVKSDYVVSFNEGAGYVAAALAGLGVIQVPSFMVQEHIAAGRLVPLLTSWCSAPKPLHLVYPPNRHLSNKVRVFVDWLAELFAGDDKIQRKSTLKLLGREDCEVARAMQ